MKIHVIDMDEKMHTLEAIEGWRVMEIIRDWELPIKAECGGCCSCATCHVYVDEKWLEKIPSPKDDEIDRLDDAFEIQDNSRLSCQIILTEEMDGLVVRLAPGTQP